MTHSAGGPDGSDHGRTGRPTLSKDDAFHLLQNRRRRAVLRHILAQGASTYVMRDVAEAVAAWENDTTVAQLTGDERQRVYISLYQSHLPKLDDADVIDYNQSRGVIEPRPAIGLLEPYLGQGLDAPQVLRDSATATASERSGLATAFAILTR